MPQIHEYNYNLNDNQLFYWRNKNISALIANNYLTVEQFMQLTNSQLWSLAEEPIANLINNNIVSIQQFMLIHGDKLLCLSREYIRVLIVNQNITMEQFLQFNDAQLRYLRYENIRNLITNNHLTVEQFLQCTNMQLDYLPQENINYLLANNNLTMEQFLQLNEIQLADLNDDNIANLITHNIITVEQFLLFDDEQIDNIINMEEETLIRLLDGNLTLENALDGDQTIAINDHQSTHNVAVHKSVSASAIRLKENYGHFIDTKEKLTNVLEHLKQTILPLPDSLKNNAAKSCVKRLIANDDFIDPTSQITNKQLLALTFMAILDTDKQLIHDIIISQEEAIETFVQGLYEIQRGYNIDYSQADDLMADSPICAGGAFNKLIEKLVGIAPECNICFITHQTEALKLHKVVEEEAIKYLSTLANPTTSEEFLMYNRLIASIRQDGLKVIYTAIKDNVANTMFKEFGTLYANENDELFTSLISTIEDVGLDDEKLNQFQQSIKASLGYQQYCSNLLYRSTGNLSFLSTKTNKEPEEEYEASSSSNTISWSKTN